MTVCESPSTPRAVRCSMRIVHCSVEPGAGFGRPGERQRKGNKNSEIEKESDGETEGKGNGKRTEVELEKEKETERKTDVQRTRERETPVKQRVSRQPNWPPLPAWYLSPPVFLVISPDPAPLGLRAPRAPGGQGQALQKLQFHLGPLDLSQLGLGDQARCSLLVLAEPGSNQPHCYATWCRHLSLGKPEDGITAPSGRSYLIWGLLFRGPAVGQCPTW